MIQGKCPLISIPLIKKSMSPRKKKKKTLTICCSFICAGRKCFQPGVSRANWWGCTEVEGKQTQLFWVWMLTRRCGKQRTLNRIKLSAGGREFGISCSQNIVFIECAAVQHPHISDFPVVVPSRFIISLLGVFQAMLYHFSIHYRDNFSLSFVSWAEQNTEERCWIGLCSIGVQKWWNTLIRNWM